MVTVAEDDTPRGRERFAATGVNDSYRETCIAPEQNVQVVFHFLIKDDFVLIHLLGRSDHGDANVTSWHDMLCVDDRTCIAWVSTEWLLDANIFAIYESKFGIGGFVRMSACLGYLVAILRSHARIFRSNRDCAVDIVVRVEFQLEKANAADTAVVLDGCDGSATVGANIEALFEVHCHISFQFSTKSRKRRRSARRRHGRRFDNLFGNSSMLQSNGIRRRSKRIGTDASFSIHDRLLFLASRTGGDEGKDQGGQKPKSLLDFHDCRAGRTSTIETM